ncbi:hypothetical protein J2S90_004887 [Arthrobacter bambusae]|uniref:Uncharacterized protein n=1 Tax=Arthrobacter bambusae TaxID=1338426 RepID=A0AAW8DNG1_9MICC|nr:hypothetical protein [Arthrobacter bambusae]MDQ0132083.1 hypothetical protein [Arthrobacter bambusae]MDQ0183424.1 hypothetical protein [Arthrobacter bambusae]
MAYSVSTARKGQTLASTAGNTSLRSPLNSTGAHAKS